MRGTDVPGPGRLLRVASSASSLGKPFCESGASRRRFELSTPIRRPAWRTPAVVPQFHGPRARHSSRFASCIFLEAASHQPFASTAAAGHPSNRQFVVALTPDAAAAESSQRMLAQVNARIQAQRRGRGGGGGGVLGSWGSENLADHDIDDGDWGGEAYATPQSRVRNLAEKHGIVVKFVDDGAASGVAQVRALARAHGIRIQILGREGGGCFEGKGEVETPAGGNEAAAADRGDTVTPPPVLSSLRTRANTPPARRSPSPLPQPLAKVIGYSGVVWTHWL